MSSSTTEEENYDRLGDLVINLGTATLRNVFHRRYKILTNLEWGQSPVTPKNFFQNVISPQERRSSFDKMTKEEKMKMQDVRLWDVSMLHKVLDNIDFCKNSNSPELSKAQSIENGHIKDLKNVRNNYGHVSKKEILDKQFNDAWEKAEKALHALGVSSNDIKLVKESKIVKKFKTIDLPTPNFTGRKDLLAKIHYQFQKCATQKEITQRIVVLRGIGGIGKSELARMYAHTYTQDPIIQNVAWINAERLTGLKSSFVRLANSLKLPTKGMEIEEILQIVYQHFSDHIGTGLFIFDNSQLMNDKPFGIYDYLPTQSFDRPPLILITARNKTWDIPKENIIAINQLSSEDSVDFLSNKFCVQTGSFKHTEKDKNAIKKLADTLQGYPLGLSLATCNIASEEFLDLSVEIEGYIERMNEPDGDWLDDEQTGAATSYKPIMSNVWKMTLEKIKNMKNSGPSSLEVLNVMAYLMPDTMTIQQVQLIFQRQLQKELSILEKFSLISIHTRGWVDEAIGGIRIHRLVQLHTRQTLDRQNNLSPLMLNCENVGKRGLKKDKTNKLYGVDEQGTMLSLHDFLKHRQWPCNSIIYSVIFCSMRCLEDASMAFKIAIDIFEFLGLDQKNSMDNKKAQTEQNDKNVLNLFYLCVFWINRRQCYGNKMRENPNLSQNILLKALSSHVRPAIEHALCFKSDLTLAQEHSYKLCFEFIKQFKTLPMEARRTIKNTQNISVTVNDIPASNIANIVYAYRLLWECFLTAETAQNALTTMETILQKHFQVYSTLEKLDASEREHQLQLYWAEGGPLYQIKTLKRSNEEGRRMMLNSFFNKNGIQCIVHNLRFLSQYLMSYNSYNTDILQVSEEEQVAFVYYFTRKLVFHWEFSDHLLHSVPFFEALLEYTNVLCQPERGYYTFQCLCLLTWFALFAKSQDNDATIVDGQMSIYSVASELHTLLMQIKKSIQGELPSCYSNLSRFKTRSNRRVLQTFLDTHKNSLNLLAVKTATSFLHLLNRNHETSSESEIDEEELESDCAELRNLETLEHKETIAAKGLYLLAYLPRLPISLRELNHIFKFCFQCEIFKDDISVLEMNGLIFVDKRYGTIVEQTCMTINKVSQHCARERLQLRSDSSYLIRICEYISQDVLKTRQGDKRTMILLHKQLKKIQWPHKSLRFSVLFCSLLIGKLENSNAAFPIVHDVFDSCRDNTRLKEVILSDPETKQLFSLCAYWIKLARYYHWHNGVKSENLNVSMSLLEKNFFAFILPSVEILIAPKTGLTDSQNLAHWLCQRIVSNIYTVNNRIRDKNFMNKLNAVILSAVNVTAILDANRLWNIFHFLRTCCFSRNVTTRMRLRFYAVITELILSSYPASLLDKTEKKIRPDKIVENMYQKPTIISLYIKDVMAICDGPLYRKRNQFLDLFFEKRGYLFLAYHFIWLNQSGETVAGNEILTFIQKLSFDWNYAQNLKDAEEFMNEFCSFTKTFASHQHDIENRHDWSLHDEKLSIQFNCLLSWFAMYAYPTACDYKLLLDVASQLNMMLDNILERGWDWNDDYIKRPEYKSYVRKDILQTFLESHCDNKLMSVAVKTAERLLEYLDEYVESSCDGNDEV